MRLGGRLLELLLGDGAGGGEIGGTGTLLLAEVFLLSTLCGDGAGVGDPRLGILLLVPDELVLVEKLFPLVEPVLERLPTEGADGGRELLEERVLLGLALELVEELLPLEDRPLE